MTTTIKHKAHCPLTDRQIAHAQFSNLAVHIGDVLGIFDRPGTAAEYMAARERLRHVELDALAYASYFGKDINNESDNNG